MVSQNGVGTSALVAQHPVRSYDGRDREPTVVWGTTCQGLELIRAASSLRGLDPDG
ncbi:MAG: hypothetical protein OEU68_04635 [Nitrospira sp.]|nr:hypothetical protein [Nitrospira sp.]MDH4242362.1 hypothetical protein [Nitrospira sp.]MDH4355639.1 hypothetical protein [Nitrospira sp.]MDH5316871.1 hypothetical protein [Nitrospira sp.]